MFGDVVNVVRVIWFTWNEDSTISTPTAADILASTLTSPWDSPLNRPNLQRRRFTPMMDKRYNLSQEGRPQVLFNWTFRGKRLPHKRVTYTGAAVASFKIYFLVVSDSNAVPNPTINMSGRLTFTDV